MIDTLPPDPHWVDAFLVEFRKHGLERTAAAAAGTTARQVRKYRDENAEFDVAYKEAEDEAADALELEARRRALEGVEKGVYFKGERVDTEVEYSDSLLQTLLKGRREAVFGDKRRITGGNGEPLTIHVKAFPVPSEPEIPTVQAKLIELMDDLA